MVMFLHLRSDSLKARTRADEPGRPGPEGVKAFREPAGLWEGATSAEARSYVPEASQRCP